MLAWPLCHRTCPVSRVTSVRSQELGTRFLSERLHGHFSNWHKARHSFAPANCSSFSPQPTPSRSDSAASQGCSAYLEPHTDILVSDLLCMLFSCPSLPP